MKRVCKITSGLGIAASCTGFLIALSVPAPARANLMISPVYGPDITADAQAIINQAIKFYTDNFTGNASVTIGFGVQPGGGASATQYMSSTTYVNYRKALNGNQTESATDVSALASLPLGSAPVGNGQVGLTTTLSGQLGFGASAPQNWTGDFCGGQIINACVAYSQTYLTGGNGGGPMAGLFGVTQHEINEVLGTSSSLSGSAAPAGNNGAPNTSIAANAADLFRYAANGVRSFSTNPAGGPSGCPDGTQAAYFSVNGGAANLVPYNNCANGGDYGDFAIQAPLKPQDYASDASNASALTLASPEVLLLDAIGYNLQSSITVAVGTLAPLTDPVISTGVSIEGGPDDGDFSAVVANAVPEPVSGAVLAFGLVALAWRLDSWRLGSRAAAA